jgi:hypothetical protein
MSPQWQRFAESATGATDYPALWQWSVTEPAAFWRAVWDHFGLGDIARVPPGDGDAAILAEQNETPEQQRALLRQGVFGNEGIFRLIASYI